MSTHLLIPVFKDDLPTEHTGNIVVFKTNIISERDVEKVRELLDQLLGRGGWNVDLADIDKVLRVKNSDRQVQEIIQLLGEVGYFCEELPD